MCLVIPGKLIEIGPDAHDVLMGRANFGEIVKQVCLEDTPEVEKGDYVLVHVGFAFSKVDEAQAAQTYQASGTTAAINGARNPGCRMRDRKQFFDSPPSAGA